VWIALLYAPSLKNGFTYDDGKVITGASALLSHPSQLARLFSTDYFLLSKESTFRPVVTLTYIGDWQIGAGSPWVFHLQSLLWHLVAVGCLLGLLKRLGASAGVRYASAAFYGVHPVLTEAVDGIGFREDVLVTAFGLLALLCLIGGWPRNLGVRLVVSNALFAAAMFSKESGVMFVFLLPLTHWAMAQHTSSSDAWPRRHLREYVSLSVCTLFYLLVRFFLLPSYGEYAARIGGSLTRSLATGTVAVGYYLRLFVYPNPLCADYRGVIAFVTSVTDWRFWVSAAAILGLTCFAWLWRRESRLMLWGWAWFLIALSPVSNVVPIPAFMAERFLHLPLVGLSVFAMSLVAALAPSLTRARAAPRARLRYASLGIGAILLVVLSEQTWARQEAWSSNEVLWRTTLADWPTAYVAQQGYGIALIERRDYADAVPYLQRALEATTIDDERRGIVLAYLGGAYLALGRLDSAKESLDHSLAAAPSARAYLNLGLTLVRLGQVDTAGDAFRAAEQLAPDWAEAHSSLGAILTMQHKTDEAIGEYQEAVRLEPSLASAHANLGMALAAQRRTAEAIEQLETALGLDPSLDQAREVLRKLK
jgi:Tfp pilus assembly protein PilF